jgi:predicted DNA-binding transcriptional regulator YafY
MKVDHDRQSRETLRHLPRAFWIDVEVRAGRYPNAGAIADHFEVSRKTAQRTIEYMRDQLRRPLEYSAEHRGWYYSEPAYPLPAIELTEGDLIAILLAERLARQYRGTALGRQVTEAFSKVLAALTDAVSVDFDALADAYSFETAATSDLDPKVFRRLGRAIVDMRQIEMTYFSAARGKATRRLVDPLHLRNYQGEWYLIAFDHLREEVRDFHAGRVRELSVTEMTFKRPEGFDLDRYLASGFGMIRGAEPIHVEMIFDEYQSRWIRERAPAHSTEQREELAGGRLKVTMTVTALDGVKRYVMQYGSHVEVLKPESLRRALAEESETIREMYKVGGLG